MKTLIVEDDFTSRVVLQQFLAPMGDTHIAVNGNEALDAFQAAIAKGTPYALICLDIVLPGINGHDVLREIRRIERSRGIPEGEGARVIMTTARNDSESVYTAFDDLCDGYVTKPIHREKLLQQLKLLGLLEGAIS
jgi:two-component system, chemotaxis family, chemotaxis protein CheY